MIELHKLPSQKESPYIILVQISQKKISKNCHKHVKIMKDKKM